MISVSDLKFFSGCGIFGTLMFIGIESYKASKKALKEAKIREDERKKVEAAKKAELEKTINSILTKFKRKYTYDNIVEVTLNNTDLTEEDRAYIYDKLYKRYSRIYYYEPEKWLAGREELVSSLEERISRFDNIYSIFSKKNKSAITSYIKNMRKEDEQVVKHAEIQEKRRAEQEKIENELKLINAKKESDLAVLKAKLDLEDSKFKTVMKTMTSVGEKNSSINLKTNVSLSGDED